MKPSTVAHVACIVACLSLSACLLNSGIVTGNLTTVYVLDPEPEGQQLLIAGTTATVLDCKPFTIDDPIVYDPATVAANGTKRESKRYANGDGCELEFQREYDADTDQWWETAIVKTRDGETFEFARLKGFLGTDRARAWGLAF